MKAFLGLFAAFLFYSSVAFSAGSCQELWVVNKDLYQQYLQTEKEFTFANNYVGYSRVADYRIAEFNFYAKYMAEPFVYLAARVSDGYEPARSFVLEIAKTFQEIKNSGRDPEAAEHLVNYYQTMIALDVTGDNVIRFAKAVDYDVARGAEVLNLQKRLEEGEGVPKSEMEGIPTLDDIFIYSIN